MRISRWLAIAVVPVALALAAPSSFAQAQDDSASTPAASSTKVGNILGPDGANILLIAIAPAVQQELKLTETQKTQIFDLMKDANQKGVDLLRSALLTGANNPQSLLAASARLRQENEVAIGKLLKKPQLDRLHELVLRVEGPLAVSRPEVSAKLKLTPQQYQQVQATVDEWRMTQRQLIAVTRQAGLNGAANPNQLAMLRQRATTLRQAASAQIGQVLSRKQKDMFNELLGQPFDLKKIDPSLAEPPPPAATSGDAPARKSKSQRTKAAKNKAAKPEDDGSSRPHPPSDNEPSRS